ncbi:class I SAM-dependent methyltransferase [uncultured Sphingomonas sp.]|uniref:class I SAM-dependent methyltransferase n=1 Tax=uncultured Sphingomonas sp. TaxID=158754 RepID=UPI002626EDFB|nr:class I SAM-dependent methyltransferase [uncultured Sphingomonas sp.]
MPDLLIHSMAEFSDLILTGLAITDAREIVEIGAEFGGMSKLLADHASAVDGSLTSIDPSVKPEFAAWAAANPATRHIAQPSLVALDHVGPADAWLVDGDHNWFTVYHELHRIDAICREHGRPLLVFLHDIGWPSGRRDMYYAPDAIPTDYRHAYDYGGGAVPESNALLPRGGFRGNGQFAFACHEGGPRNGVLCAVEDFIADLLGNGRTLAFAEINAVFGLGVLFSEDAPWSEALGQHLLPFHQNPLLATLERNRLANYLRVIELQEAGLPA